MLKEAAEEAAKAATNQLLAGLMSRAPDGLSSIPGPRPLKLGPQDFERRDGAGEQDTAR